MIVRSKTPRLERLRRGVMELYISDHPLDCLTCSANGDCELQTQAGNVGLRDVRYGYDGAKHAQGVLTSRLGWPATMMVFSLSVAVGQALTQAPHDTHSDSRKFSSTPADTCD